MSRFRLPSNGCFARGASRTRCFDLIPHDELLKSVARRIVDRHVLRLLKLWLKAPIVSSSPLAAFPSASRRVTCRDAEGALIVTTARASGAMGGGEHSGSAEAVADQNRGRGKGLTQVVGGGDQSSTLGIAAFDNFQYPIDTILAGHVYRMADVPRWYVPAYVGIKLSLPLIVGACLSLFLGALPRHAARAIGEGRRRETAFVALAALLPLICCVIIHGPGFTGMRHYLFTVPPIAVLAGLGFDGALRALQASHRVAAAAGLAVVLFCFGGDATILYRLHPDEYLFYNPIVGGLEGSSRRYATDYWVNIMPEAVGDLEHFLDRTEPASDKLSTRRYLVGVCGERLSFEKEAPPAMDARLGPCRFLHCADTHELRPRARRPSRRNYRTARGIDRSGQGSPRSHRSQAVVQQLHLFAGID